ncbi:MAG: hypothetical protein EOQ89_03555 [Mesorhizobium sp.]|nr:MAG: hypothetical protein EOQ89_03555 [Mesorhizobium sp.]
MAYSYNDFPSKVAGDTITVGFPFIDRSHVAVTVGGVTVASNKWAWINDGLISCLTGFPAGAGRVARTTPAGALAGRLIGTAVLDYPMVNANFDRTLYILQEKADVEAERQAQIDALSQEVDDALVTFAASLTAANAARDTAITKAGEASASATTAAAQASTATTQATNSAASATLSQQWAANPEDSVVSGGLYSALHYAAKAAASLASITNGLAGWIHGATTKTTPVDADEFGYSDSAAAWGLKKFTWENLKGGILAYFNATAKAVPHDDDRVWIGDSTSSYTPKYSTWTQLKAFLKTYFDTLYAWVGVAVAGDIIYGSGAGTWARLPKGTSLQTLRMNAGATAPEWASPVLSGSFESSQQTITSAGALTLAHGLGVKPKVYQAFLHCTTAEHGYSVGDEVATNPHISASGGADNRGVVMVPDATNINIRYGSASAVFPVLNKTTGALAAATNGSWRLIIRAWA